MWNWTVKLFKHVVSWGIANEKWTSQQEQATMLVRSRLKCLQLNCMYCTEPPPLAVVRIITPSLPPQLGKPYSSTCLVTPLEFLPATIEVQWIGPDGMLIASQSSSQEVSATEEVSLQLNLNDLEASDAGLYMCVVLITSPILESPQTIRRTLNLTLPDVLGMFIV